MAGEFKLAEAFVELKARGASELKTKLSGIRGIASKLGSVFTNLGRTMLKAFNPLTLALGALAGGVGVRSLLKLASDAEEVGSMFSVVFSNMSGEAEQTAADLKKYLGASTTEVKAALANLGDTFKPLGFAEEEALKLSATMTRLAGDLASFKNMSFDEALQRLQATLIGNHENALKFGVIINENTLKAKMAELGTDKLTGSAKEQAKVFARLTLLMEGTTDAQGDLGRTSDSFANSTKRMWSMLKELGETIGTAIMPIFQGLGNIISALSEKANEFIGGQLPRLNEALSTVKAILDGIADGIRGSSFDGWSSQLSSAFKDASDILMATIKAVGQFLLSIAVQAGQLIGEGIIAAMPGSAAAGVWNKAKKGYAITAARLAGASLEEARGIANEAVDGPKASPMAALAGAARSAFGPGSELADVFSRVAGNMADKVGEKVGDKVEAIVPEKPVGADLSLFPKPRWKEIDFSDFGEPKQEPAEKAESGLRSFSGLWESLQNRMSKGEEEINKEQKRQTDILNGIKANGDKQPLGVVWS